MVSSTPVVSSPVSVIWASAATISSAVSLEAVSHG
jgi:hypothetical protein